MSGPPSSDNGYLADHVEILLDSYRRALGRPLFADLDSSTATARALFFADFAILSSGTESDPLFSYANQTALALFELDWATLIALPARESAEPAHQSARAKLMAEVESAGFTEGYSGVRISASGQRFMIEDATIWNLVAADGTAYGQAATFKKWRHDF